MAARQNKLSRKAKIRTKPEPKKRTNRGEGDPLRSKLKLRWYLLLCMIPMAIALSWTIKPSFEVIYAASKLRPIDITQSARSLKREIQKNFRMHGIYVDMQDIVVVTEVGLFHSNVVEFMESTCGSAEIYIWLPLRFRLPIYGDYIYEHCWIPDYFRP